MTRTLHVAVIPDSVRLSVCMVHLAGTQVDDLALLHWAYHPEEGWALGFNPHAALRINVRATLLARRAGEPDFIAGPAILAGTDTQQMVDVTHDLIASLERF